MENVIKSLKTSWSDAETLLAHPPVEEEPVVKEPSSIYEKVQIYLECAIEHAITGAKLFKKKDPKTHLYVHYENFPEKLYQELQDNPDFKEELETLGFEFYITHNGEPKPMLRFVLRF